MFCDWTSEKKGTICWIIWLFWFGINLVIEAWFNQKLYVCYFRKIHLICLTILPLIKSGTLCLIIYCVDLGFTWLLKSDLSRHNMLAVSLRFIFVVSRFDQWIKHTLCAEHKFIIRANLHVMIMIWSIYSWFVVQ